MSTLYVWWGIALFVLLSLLIAYMARSGKATSLSDYFLANRSLGGGVSALSYSATTFSAFMLSFFVEVAPEFSMNMSDF